MVTENYTYYLVNVLLSVNKTLMQTAVYRYFTNFAK